MSFGFSIGDFIAVMELANRVRKEFVAAPSQFKSLSDEVRNLSIILHDIDVNLSGQGLDSQQRTHLQELSCSCQNVLGELRETLVKYRAIGYRSGNMMKVVWKRLTWEPEDVREVRERIVSTTTALNIFLGQISSQTIFEARRGVAQLIRQQGDEERLHVLGWLAATDYSLQQSDFLNRRQPGTGQWLLSSEKHQSWLKTAKETLFYPGIPGAGKTILTAIVIDDLQSRGDPEVGIAYLYCNFRQRAEQKVDSLLANLLKQLSRTRSSLPESVKALYDQYNDSGMRPSCDEISRALQAVSSTYTRVFIIIDALDECQAFDGCRTRFLAEIFKVQAKSAANILVTSRPIPEITEMFRESMALEVRASEEDVRRYIDGHMFRLPGFVHRNPELQEQIKERIVLVAQGMFLLAQLHLESFIGKRSVKAVRAALERLPTGTDVYDQAYKDAMDRIEGQLADQKELALQVLSWITCARRPLKSLELRHALAIEVGEPRFDEDNLPQVEDMVSVCAGLVTIDEESGIIRLVHHTTQEYFERTQKHWFPRAESDITTSCITYLSYSHFATGTCGTGKAFEERLGLHPLYDYAARNWGFHAREVPLCQQDSIYHRIAAFADDEGALEASAQALRTQSRARKPKNNQDTPAKVTGLHLAACFAVEWLAKALIENGATIDAKDRNGDTPLSWAADSGHGTIVRLLLDKGADCRAENRIGRIPLSYAAQRGYLDICRLFLAKGVSPETDAEIHSGLTPLSHAVQAGHADIVQLLLGAGASIEAGAGSGLTPLLYAARSGHEAIVNLLLENGANPETRTEFGLTPLAHAAYRGHEAIVRLLLDKGANFETGTNNGRTPLSYAAQSGHLTIVQLLLHRGARLDVEAKSGLSPLSYAAKGGHEAVVKHLLANGAALETKSKSGLTALSYAVCRGHKAVVQLFLDNDAGLTAKTESRSLPLLHAAQGGHTAIMQLLLDNGAKLEMKSPSGLTPLSYAAYFGRKAAVQLLLDRGADLEARTKAGRTPLSYAVQAGREDIVDLLLDRGANVKPKAAGGGLTPMSYAILAGRESVVRMLKERCRQEK